MPVYSQCRVNSGQLVQYDQYLSEAGKAPYYNFENELPKDNKINGEFSKKSKKRFSDIIKNWLSVIDAVLWVDHDNKKLYHRYITFCTLTLSFTQYHSDKEVRRFMLNPFLRDVKEKFGVKSYLYCSEAQKNGNIHFHIVLDREIYWRQIRDIWNRIQAAHCYINCFELFHFHRDPNSTDIHSFKKINSIGAYMIKYFTKDENRRKIEGRLWGSSDNLREIEPYRCELDNVANEVLSYLYDNKAFQCYESDFFTLFKNLNFSILYDIDKSFTNSVIQHYYGYKELLHN